jgi:hypothetical protein
MIDPTFRTPRPRSNAHALFLAIAPCALFATTLVATGCGSSDSGGSTTDTGTSTDGAASDTSTTDSGTGDTAKTDTGTTDSKTGDTGTTKDTSPADVGPPPTGTKLVAGDFNIVGVTSDDYVIVFDNGSNALQAIPLAGGPAKTIDDSPDAASIQGKVVFSWHGVDADNIGGLTTWTATGGAKTVSTASRASIAAASDDGTSIAYTDAAVSAGTGNLVKSALDGTGKVTVSAVTITDSCTVTIQRAGTRFVASYCEAATGGATVASFDDTGTKATLLADAKQFFTFDKAATKVFVMSSAGAASIVPLAGGTATAIDTAVDFGMIRPDGTGVLYRSGASLKKASATGSDITTLVASGVAGLGELSPDGNFIAYVGSSDSTTGLTDAFLASTITAGTPTTLNAATTTDLSNFGAMFTADSSHVLFSTDVDSDSSGTLKTQAVSAGTARTIGTAAWYALVATGAKVAFTDGYVAGSGGDPDRADLRVVDTATTAAPTLVQSSINVSFGLSTAKDKVVYSYTLVPDSMGVYVNAIP